MRASSLKGKQPFVDTIVVAGAGYTGQKLLRALTGQVERLMALSKTTLIDIPGVESIQLDLDAPVSQRVAVGDNPLLCYLIPPSGADEPALRFRNLVEQVMGRRPARVVLISTTGVYGDCQGEWVDETRLLNPQTDRAKKRAKVEAYCNAWAEEQAVDLVIFRVAGIYGPGRVPVARLQRGMALPKNQSGGFSNRIHVDDLVSACVAGLFGTATGVFNVADGQPMQYREYFNLVSEVWNLPAVAERDADITAASVSPTMRSYLRESRKINNTKLLTTFSIELCYPHPRQGLLASRC